MGLMWVMYYNHTGCVLGRVPRTKETLPKFFKLRTPGYLWILLVLSWCKWLLVCKAVLGGIWGITHSSTLMMNDHIHAHTPNLLMSLCICNANVTAKFSCYMYDAHYMEHSNQLYFMSSTMQDISQAYKFHTFHANLYRYRSIMHISIHQYMTKQVMSYSLP